MIKTRPFRRTSLQSLSRSFADLNEFRILIIHLLIKERCGNIRIFFRLVKTLFQNGADEKIFLRFYSFFSKKRSCISAYFLKKPPVDKTSACFITHYRFFEKRNRYILNSLQMIVKIPQRPAEFHLYDIRCMKK